MNVVDHLDDFSSAVKQAAERIQHNVLITPVDHSLFLSEATKAKVFIKLESEQATGSFKIRGACNKTLKTLEDEAKINDGGKSIRETGVTLASTGNHALACLHILKQMGVSSTVFCPNSISAGKEETLVLRGAMLMKGGDDAVEGENRARQAAQNEGKLFISPYNDYDVIAGQGTIGLELLTQLPDLDVVFVPVGGGGLMAGIAAYIKHNKPSVKVVGCQPEASKVMYESVKAGKIIHEESHPTLSDGTAGGLEKGTITFPICQHCVDDWVLVTEEEISRALYLTLKHHHKLVEGSAAMTLACVIKEGSKYAGKTIAAISCGNNISVGTVREILNKYQD